MAADVAGQSWDELVSSVVEDPDDVVAELFRTRQTWSGRLVYWNVDTTGEQVPVHFAGVPMFGKDRELAGFRGFGLLRTDLARRREPPPQEPAQSDGSWFADIRQRVVAHLSGAGPPVPDQEPEQPPEEAPAPAPEKPSGAGETSLSEAERNAFREIALTLLASGDAEALSQTSEPAVPQPPGAPAPQSQSRGDERLSQAARVAELEEILDGIGEGIVVIDHTARILSLIAPRGLFSATKVAT